jgi:cell wall-associated NlpC family hydrolase
MAYVTIPDLAALIEPLLGLPYSERNCRGLVEHLFYEGFGLDLGKQSGTDLNIVFQEIWWHRDQVDPLSLAHPWDLVIMDEHDLLPVGTHVGVVVDSQRFVHARNSATGVALGRLRTWRPRLLQMARYRELI